MPGICLRAIPRLIMNTSRTHPRTGKVCHIFTLSGRAAILPQYLSTILRNIRKKPVRTAAVIRSSHHMFCDGCILYASIPFNVMIIPGIPQMTAATTYKCLVFISHQYLMKLYFSLISSFPESERLLKYAFHPGQKFICHLQNLPAKEFGLASCFALIGHVVHL